MNRCMQFLAAFEEVEFKQEEIAMKLAPEFRHQRSRGCGGTT